MDNRPVLFLDSGIGSLPYAIFFHSRNAKEKSICVADRANFPYGTKLKETVVELVLSLTKKSIELYNPKLIVVACNTATVSSLPALRTHFPNINFVGTVPAVKPAVLASKKRCVSVLGTQRTIADPCIAELAGQYGPDCTIAGEAAPELVEFVQYRWADADYEERLLAIKPWIEKALIKGADALVLACTHFLLLKEEFVSAGGNEMGIFDSVEGVSRRIGFLLDSLALCSGSKNEQQILLKITGEDPLEPYWEKITACFGIIPERL